MRQLSNQDLDAVVGGKGGGKGGGNGGGGKGGGGSGGSSGGGNGTSGSGSLTICKDISESKEICITVKVKNK